MNQSWKCSMIYIYIYIYVPTQYGGKHKTTDLFTIRFRLKWHVGACNHVWLHSLPYFAPSPPSRERSFNPAGLLGKSWAAVGGLCRWSTCRRSAASARSGSRLSESSQLHSSAPTSDCCRSGSLPRFLSTTRSSTSSSRACTIWTPNCCHKGVWITSQTSFDRREA